MLCLTSYHGDTSKPKGGLGHVWTVCGGRCVLPHWLPHLEDVFAGGIFVIGDADRGRSPDLILRMYQTLKLLAQCWCVCVHKLLPVWPSELTCVHLCHVF